MASCPLYKSLKQNGTSFYAFPGAAEDISSAYMNQNYKMYFSKYVLLNLPKQNLEPGSGLTSSPVYWDFDNTSELGYGFDRSISYTQPTSYQDQLVESLRNYVANQEITIKESKLNNTDYYYNNTEMGTPSEKIFWKWCKKLNLLDLEAANIGDEYFGNLIEFESNNLNDDTYFPEILWREREVSDFRTLRFYETGVSGFINQMEVEFSGTTNFRVGDLIEIYNLTNTTLTPLFGTSFKITVDHIIPPGATQGQRVVLNTPFLYDAIENTGKAKLVYNKLVCYIGEVNGINNVQEASRSYTEVYAHIPDHTGSTPDILFRTKFDKNYKPNMTFPILPSQYQPEIIGAEIFSNPIVSNPNNYPGGYYGQFDTKDFTYETSSGDTIRRSGDYFGITGDVNSPIINTNFIDGLSIDFDTSHYVKMNIIGREISNFDQFNALEINNQPPSDFEFNAILWYYTVEDVNGNKTDNLYGISFVDNPDNNPVESEFGIRIPSFKKLAANSEQDGISYAFSLNLNFNIINENVQDTYNPESINSLFSFNLFNEAMKRLGNINSSFSEIISSQGNLEQDIMNMKQLLYSQKDFQVINSKISNLENLLKLYSTMQIVDSDTIGVDIDNGVRPPRLSLNSKDTSYNVVYNILTSDLYNTDGNIPYLVDVPDNKNFLIHIENNDISNIKLPNDDKLVIIINSDLSYKQSVDIHIDSTETSTQNKQIEVFINYRFGSETNMPVYTKILGPIDLPVHYNTSIGGLNISKKWDSVSFNINMNNPITLNSGGILYLPIYGDGKLVSNSFNGGDTIVLNGFMVGTSSQLNFSGQYVIDSVGMTNSYINLDVSNNQLFTNYGASNSLPIIFNDSSNYLLSNMPTLNINRGSTFRITRIETSDQSSPQERYLIGFNTN